MGDGGGLHVDAVASGDRRGDADLAVGQVVGEYRIEHKIGQGGFGTVFKGVHPLIGKQVAIKVLSQRFSVDPQMVSRFLAEARAVNQIRHHNIIDIFSFGTLARTCTRSACWPTSC
jgi:eukaryotic-like serine/threonine-protein kinase